MIDFGAEHRGTSFKSHEPVGSPKKAILDLLMTFSFLFFTSFSDALTNGAELPFSREKVL